MMEYTKLLRIKYNNKIFDIFCDCNHRKTFLEVKIKDNTEKYYHPELVDLINLNLIYNVEKEELYKQKFGFAERLLICSFALNIGLMIGNKITIHNYNEQVDRYINIVFGEDYKIGNDDRNIYNISELDDYGYDKVTFDDVRETLKNNEKIDEKYRNYIDEYINTLEVKLPDIDLRVFNINLETLKFKIYTNEKFDKEYEPWLGAFYVPKKNTIHLRDTYSTQKIEKETVFHELTHTIIHSGFIKNNKLDYKGYEIGGYGDSADEAITAITTTYLLSDNWENYFASRSHDYESYERYADIYYDLMKLTDYNLYDYVNGNILDLQGRLKGYNLEDVIDTLDVIKNSEDKALVLEKEKELKDIQDNILEAIVNKNLNDDLIKIKTVDDTYPYSQNVIVDDPITVNENYQDKEGNTYTDEYVLSSGVMSVQSKCLIRIHDNLDIYDIPLETLAIYPVYEDREIAYRFAYTDSVYCKETDNGYIEKSIYQDLLTKEEFTFDKGLFNYPNNQFESLDMFLYNKAGIDIRNNKNYVIDIDISILNNTNFKEYYNSLIDKDELKDQIGISR